MSGMKFIGNWISGRIECVRWYNGTEMSYENSDI